MLYGEGKDGPMYPWVADSATHYHSINFEGVKAL